MRVFKSNHPITQWPSGVAGHSNSPNIAQSQRTYILVKILKWCSLAKEYFYFIYHKNIIKFSSLKYLKQADTDYKCKNVKQSY